ncbi:hypothetical protein ASG89_08295 [Paenibacillus sp. Soil766]|uniref:carbohydrate ABC transporter permease n=1 Tax=Paenibacillus sp. Soil766 TaxID=1736404 RepID=UPI00070B910C|nr:ABC transporter permease subunit [Paenibacillus sp. Soil766]KRE90292.1 hypothetical protein ASG89_08295 [Paenibacillus sp. Soil766]
MLAVVIAQTVLSLVLAPRLAKIIFGLFIAGLIVPSQVNMLPIYSFTHKLGWSDHLYGLVLVSVAMLMPLTVIMLKGFMQVLNQEILEADSIDGASEWKLYSRTALPLSAPSLKAMATFLYVMVWNDLLIPMLLTGVVITAVPMIVMFLFFQRYFVAGVMAGSLKG